MSTEAQASIGTPAHVTGSPRTGSTSSRSRSSCSSSPGPSMRGSTTGARPTSTTSCPLRTPSCTGDSGCSRASSYLNELVPMDGLFYVVYPPMPALILLPAVALFGVDFHQAWASILLGAASVSIMASILRAMGVRRMPLIVLSLVFAFGTIVWYSRTGGLVMALRPRVATFFMLLAIRACQLDARTGVDRSPVRGRRALAIAVDPGSAVLHRVRHRSSGSGGDRRPDGVRSTRCRAAHRLADPDRRSAGGRPRRAPGRERRPDGRVVPGL